MKKSKHIRKHMNRLRTTIYRQALNRRFSLEAHGYSLVSSCPNRPYLHSCSPQLSLTVWDFESAPKHEWKKVDGKWEGDWSGTKIKQTNPRKIFLRTYRCDALDQFTKDWEWFQTCDQKELEALLMEVSL